jgi:UDP-N-acetylglucosamine--N-acetylmuramyl-(pentapeptide) pyrophosphoryl-undecaprenol N-acetylglucosamine transferase
MEKVPEAGYKIKGLPVAGFQRRITLKNITFFVKLWNSMRISKQIIREFKPQIVVGVGGYASGPILRAAAKAGITVVFQEQNSYAGVTNRLLAGKARKIFVAFEGMEKYFPADKLLITGNPVRQDIVNSETTREEALRFYNLDPEKKTVLVIGGSLGSGTINDSLLKGFRQFDSNTQIIWQTGKNYYKRVKEEFSKSASNRIHIVPFIKNMELAYKAADIIISRAGAGTISELTIVGKPVILVPSPNVAEDHQTKNARSLVEKDAALMVHDKDAEESLVNTCAGLLRDERRMDKLGRNIMQLARYNSAERIAKEILKMI